MFGMLPTITPPRPGSTQEDWDDYERKLNRKHTTENVSGVVFCSVFALSIILSILFLVAMF